MSTITLYGTPLSGHVHRVALLLRMLALPYEWVEASADVRQSAAFRRLNPFGQIPVLQDGDLTLADSNAILVYLAKRYAPDSHWLPEQPAAAARVQAWLSKAAGEVRYGPASCRLIAQFAVPEDYQAARAISDRFLPQMEQHLSERGYLARQLCGGRGRRRHFAGALPRHTALGGEHRGASRLLRHAGPAGTGGELTP